MIKLLKPNFLAMFRNYFVIGIRNLIRQKWASLISVLGLSTAISLFTIILLYVWYENNFDGFHTRLDRIYLVEGEKWTNTPAPLANILLDEFPEIENVMRVLPYRNSFLIGNKGENLTALNHVMVADSSIFKIFSFNITAGDAGMAFPTWNSMAISESIAKQLFGSENPIGKSLTLDTYLNYVITAVYSDLPKNSSFKANAVIPFYGLDKINGDPDIFKIWSNWNYYTWVLLKENTNSEALLTSVRERLFNLFTEDFGWRTEGVQLVKLRPFKGLYFDKTANINLKRGNKNLMMVLTAVGFFILVIACINFVNLSTAKAMRRTKEIGLRKTVGATRSTLIAQFMVEVFLLTLCSVLISIMLTELFLPEFNKLVVSELSIFGFGFYRYLFVIFVTLLGVTFLAGVYPAFFLTSSSPVSILRGDHTKGTRGSIMRKSLIVFQFVVAVVLAISSIVVYNQMQFLKKHDLGFNKEQILYFWQGDVNRKLLREQLQNIAGVEKVSFASAVPGQVGMSWGRVVDGKDVTFSSIICDPEYLDLLEVEFVEGRNFSYEFASDSMGAMIFNQKAIKEFGIENPLEKTMNHAPGQPAPIIGVVKDFHFTSLHKSIEPIGIFFGNIGWGYHTCVVKVSGDVPAVISGIKGLMSELRPGIPFSYFFLDETYDLFYKKEERLSKSFTYFTIMAILIACLGLFAMASYAAEQRVKEIGIRKVLGANDKLILMLISKDFGLYVLIANVIAWPIAYYAMNSWLESFPYRITPELSVFLIVGAASLVIMQLTILYKAIKASRINPAVTLKYE